MYTFCMDKLLLEKRTIFDVNALGYYLNISSSNTLKKGYTGLLRVIN